MGKRKCIENVSIPGSSHDEGEIRRRGRKRLETTRSREDNAVDVLGQRTQIWKVASIIKRLGYCR